MAVPGNQIVIGNSLLSRTLLFAFSETGVAGVAHRGAAVIVINTRGVTFCIARTPRASIRVALSKKARIITIIP